MYASMLLLRIKMLKRRQRMGHVMGLPVNEYILKDTLTLLFGYQIVEATK